MLKHLSENRVLIDLVWSYEPASHEPYYLDWLSHLRRTHRQLTGQSDEGEMVTGFCTKHSTLYEPFALWMKALYGDGIHYYEQAESCYFLIISHGVPVSGSDRLVSRRFWMKLKEQLKESPQYAELPLIQLTEQHIEAVIEGCTEHQRRQKKRRQMMIGVLIAGGIVFLLVFMTLLKLFIKG